ncbi:MAG: sulfotransferase [Sulfurovaceae bacterium]
MSSEKNMLIIAGVHKSATTSLYEYLMLHKDICCGKKKEIHYYTPLRYEKNIDSLDSYLQQFSQCTEKQYFLEASPSYLYGKSVIAQKIHNDFKNARIIMILREPTERFISFFRFTKSDFRLNKDIEFRDFIDKSYALKDAVDTDDLYYRTFREGEYSKYLEEWFNVFGDSLKVIFFDDIKENPQNIIFDLCRWLHISDNLYKDLTIFEIKNKTKASRFKSIYKVASFINMRFELFFRKHPSVKKTLYKLYFLFNEDKTKDNLQSSDIDYLRTLYADENKKLAILLKKHGYTKLPKWLDP